MTKTFFISKINSANDFWTWANNVLVKELRADAWYNGDQPYGLAGYINDRASRMIGYATIRQIRTKNGNKKTIKTF